MLSKNISYALYTNTCCELCILKQPFKVELECFVRVINMRDDENQGHGPRSLLFLSVLSPLTCQINIHTDLHHVCCTDLHT